MFSLLRRYRKLQELGVLGMNQRNICYIGRYNQRRMYPNVDNKLKTKLLAQEYGVQTPELIGVMETQHDLQDLAQIVRQRPGFVVKPSKGSGGKGILLLRPASGGGFEKLSGDPVSDSYIKTHTSNILSGLYSLGGKPDIALIEALINPDPIFDRYSYRGVPDIRVIVFQGFPVMAMIRLPTQRSDGKANLHQGAIGVGLDLGSGHSTSAVQFDQSLTHHPDTGFDLRDVRVEDWGTLLLLAARCNTMCGLGYIGVDIVLDRDFGPMLLELNARPGLAIQIANQCGLLTRLRAIEALGPCAQLSPEEKVHRSRCLFGSGYSSDNKLANNEPSNSGSTSATRPQPT